MTTVRVALAQSNYTVGDVDGNAVKIEHAVDRAHDADADLVVCSELSLTGYPPRDLLEREAFVADQRAALDRIAARTDDDLTAIVGFAARSPGETGKAVRNVAAVCRGGRVVGTTAKRLLPTYDVFDEDRYFEAADGQPVHPLDAAESVDVGVSICEDAWNEPDVWERPLYEDDPIEDLVAAGAELLVNCSASPFAVRKPAFRERLFADHATDHGRWLVFVNQVGGNDELVFDGRSFVVAPDGSLACRLAAFEADFAVCEIPLDGGSAAAAATDRDAALAPEPDDDAAEVWDAIALGLRDYVHKSGFEDVVLGLSGGIDSAVTAAVAADALGVEHVLALGMSTRYTSDESEADARAVAENLGIEYRDVPIEKTFEAFESHLVPVLDEEFGVTEENVQARVRGTTLMAVANEESRLVLATGNRSELAVGYTTLYGDMVGALAPLADVPKTDVYELAEHANRETETIPESVVRKPPSAELRPDQTDEDDLPPYATLDAVLAGYVDQGMTADELVAAGHDRETVREVLGLLHRSEHKRWQAPPVLKVSPKAFGVGWRYPLAADCDSVLPDGPPDRPQEE